MDELKIDLRSDRTRLVATENAEPVHLQHIIDGLIPRNILYIKQRYHVKNTVWSE